MEINTGSILLGISSVMISLILGSFAITMTNYWSKKTDKLIKSEDACAKELLE